MKTGARIDTKFIALAVALAAAAFVVPGIFRGAAIALALAVLVVASLPRGTRHITIAAMAGMATGPTVIMSFAFSIFQGPITKDFGWSQTEYAAALPIGALVVILMSPFVGRLYDRMGVRQFSIASAIGVGFVILALYLLTDSIWQFYGMFALLQVAGAGLSSVAYSRVIARWFSEYRGQAFGTAIAGIGIGGAITSPLAQYLVEWLGWRSAFASLGLISLLFTAPLLFLWLHDGPESRNQGPDGQGLGADRTPSAAVAHPAHIASVVDYTASESRRKLIFWKMCFAFFVMSLGTGGVMLQLFPILRANGVSADQAVVDQGALGLALILGPPVAGYLMDRIFAPYVAALFVLFPMAGTALLASGAVGLPALLATLAIGMAIGAEVNFIACLIPRYFGTRAYSENFGWMYAAFCIGSGLAPLLTSLSVDLFNSHAPALYFYVGSFAIASVLLARLGAYPARPAAGPATLQPA